MSEGMARISNQTQASTQRSILDHLRSGTAELHASLEAALPLGEAELSLPEYVTVLKGFRGFFAGWEARACSVAPAALHPLLKERVRTHLLDADLRALAATIPRSTAREFLPLHTTPALLGSMYVLEGSRLGGQYLVRDLAARLGLTPQHGLSFFYGFGPQTGSQWKAFCRIVVDQVTRDDEDVALEAARATFTAFEGWMVPYIRCAAARIQVNEPAR